MKTYIAVFLFVLAGLHMMAAPRLAAEYPSASGTLLKGGDISMLPRFEELGAVYRDGDGPADAIGIMMRKGCNCFRVRIFVNPPKEKAVIQDLDYTLRLARRIKKAGAFLLLDIHYSDTWADPSKQIKPAAWEALSFDELEARVESYTTGVIAAMKENGCLPDIVQVGNEITPGFLWPEGRLRDAKGGWENFTKLLKAGIRGVKKPLGEDDNVRIMIHVDQGGSASTTSWFFENIEKHNVQYDMIGLSYYPYWHGDIDALRSNLNATAERFKKDIVVVETAYPWRKGEQTENMDWPQTPQGQRQFMDDVIDAVQSTPNGLGKGVLWWYPESIPNKSLKVWMDGRMALFDQDGLVLPALDAFMPKGRRQQADQAGNK